MLISELAKKAGCHPETLRRLEKRGLITAKRDVNGWRRYSPAVVDQIKALYAEGEAPDPIKVGGNAEESTA
jgi:DNA-binding transcriptional MerR regulator